MRAGYRRADADSTVPEPIPVERLERARLGRMMGLGAIALLVALGLFNVLGPRQGEVSASGRDSG